MRPIQKRIGAESFERAPAPITEPNQGQSPDALNSTTQAPAISTKLVYSVQELCVVLSCSVSTIYEGLRRGTIPSIRVSKRKYLIPVSYTHLTLPTIYSV